MFETGTFILHSGLTSTWRINLDDLTDADWAGIATIAVSRLPSFGAVEGVPEGGLRLAEALKGFVSSGPLLIVDDVLTTGGSMIEHRSGRDAIGLVVFARGTWPRWVIPLFVDWEVIRLSYLWQR